VLELGSAVVLEVREGLFVGEGIDLSDEIVEVG